MRETYFILITIEYITGIPYKQYSMAKKVTFMKSAHDQNQQETQERALAMSISGTPILSLTATSIAWPPMN